MRSVARWELVGAITFVVIVSTMSGLADLPLGMSRLWAYIGVAFPPTALIQYRENQRLVLQLNAGEFVGATALAMTLVLGVAVVIEILIELGLDLL